MNPTEQQRYIDHLAATQLSYAERRIDDYLSGFTANYYSVQVGTEWGEDKAQLAAKVASDIERFELLSMDFEVVRHWFAGGAGFAHLRYHTRLRLRDKDRILVDRRENILVGEQVGEGRWGITCKIVLKAENYYE
jgi:hypothetical protein